MVAKVERLVNLTVALMRARRPVTLHDIRRTVAGYEQSDPEAARRMFERDKEDLRRLGVPVETVPLDAFEAEWGYRIDRDRYAMPPLDLSVEEVTALAVALHVAGDDASRLGFAKVAARAPDPRATGTPRTQVEVGAGALDALADALLERRRVTFPYRTAGGEESRRTVDPYGVAHRRGVWYVVGRDHDRDALRAFRLDRLTGAPRPSGPPAAFEVPGDLDLRSLVAGPAVEGVDVDVAFAPEVAWDATRRGEPVGERPDGWQLVRFRGADPERLVPWVLTLGPDAEVTAPAEVRAAVVGRLDGVLGR